MSMYMNAFIVCGSGLSVVAAAATAARVRVYVRRTFPLWRPALSHMHTSRELENQRDCRNRRAPEIVREREASESVRATEAKSSPPAGFMLLLLLHADTQHAEHRVALA